MSHLPDSEASEFFLKRSASFSLFLWLSFCRFVEQGKVLSLNSQACSDISSSVSGTPTSLQQWLTLWQQQAFRPQHLIRLPWWLWGVCLITGAVTMSGVLAVQAGGIINIWLPLFLFAFFPCLLSLLTAVSAASSPEKPRHPPLGYHWLAERYQLPDFQPNHLLLRPWLARQLQQGASLMVLGGLIAFFVFATFQEIRFYWSSTFIQNYETMAAIFHWIALPWQLWLEAPALSVVEASQFSVQPFAEPGQTEQSSELWSFVVAAVLTYGLLPRLLLMALFNYQLKSRLGRAIQTSVVPEQFLNHQQHTVSIDPLQQEEAPEDQPQDTMPVATKTETEEKATKRPDQQEPQTETEIKSQPRIQEPALTGYQVGWRLSETEIPVRHNLGLASWQADEDWLNQLSTVETEAIALIADLWQIPTGELADIAEQLRDKGVTLRLILINAQNIAAERTDVQLKTWQFFADRHQLPLEQSSKHDLMASLTHDTERSEGKNG
ncbi:DUF2868 domain-containing protein [Oceanospirillum sediminis]|uniref:DUF2868 domain-containing protein n=1 Tax=Oceanospirillum sediminis TaxID=2760088 RepID=A0A839IX95_9GAMM|nr:DUF2868 domain-containing protein [Oceanospirillum sediminis]MBB1488997.1 DUF2868 domain-containing protein [Oceanospirillum sediminis]